MVLLGRKRPIATNSLTGGEPIYFGSVFRNLYLTYITLFFTFRLAILLLLPITVSFLALNLGLFKLSFLIINP